MTELHAALAARVVGWGAGGYAHDRYPAIAEILRHAVDGEDPAQPFPASTFGRTRRHGRFFEHTPADARVTFERADGYLRVRVDDVISPSIMERLAGQEGVLAPQIEDWRWVVDSVAIDSAYDGEVFDVDLIDVPERRADLVDGAYELDAPAGERPAAVRITDMLGEEILVVERR